MRDGRFFHVHNRTIVLGQSPYVIPSVRQWELNHHRTERNEHRTRREASTTRTQRHNVQERKLKKGYLEPKAKCAHQDAEKRSVWSATLSNPERRHGIVPAHDTGRKMVKTPPPSRDL